MGKNFFNSLITNHKFSRLSWKQGHQFKKVKFVASICGGNSSWMSMVWEGEAKIKSQKSKSKGKKRQKIKWFKPLTFCLHEYKYIWTFLTKEPAPFCFCLIDPPAEESFLSYSLLAPDTRYSKEGIGYLSPFGQEDEGSKNFLSTWGCFPEGMVGFPLFITWLKLLSLLITITFSIFRALSDFDNNWLS